MAGCFLLIARLCNFLGGLSVLGAAVFQFLYLLDTGRVGLFSVILGILTAPFAWLTFGIAAGVWTWFWLVVIFFAVGFGALALAGALGRES